MKNILIILLIIFLVAIAVTLVSFFTRGGSSASGIVKTSAKQGILISKDAGQNWEMLQNFRGESIAEFIIGKAEPRHLFVGTLKNGFWVGDENGEIWQHGLSSEYQKKSRVYDIAEDPLEKGNALYLAIYQKNRGRLLHYNLANNSFKELYFTPLEKYAIFGVKVNPSNPNIIWLAVSDGGFYESQDRGKTWRAIKRFKEGLLNLVDDKRQAGHLWVVTSRGNIFETFNSGRDWTDVSQSLINFPGAREVKDLFFDEKAGILYLASRYGLLRTLDGGRNWEALPLLVPPDVLPIRTVYASPYNSRQIYAASGNQLFRSNDGGFSWQGMALPTKYKIAKILINSRDSKIIYTGLEK